MLRGNAVGSQAARLVDALGAERAVGLGISREVLSAEVTADAAEASEDDEATEAAEDTDGPSDGAEER